MLDPNKWKPIEAEPIRPQIIPPPPTSDKNPYLRTTIPADQQLQPDMVKQRYTSAIPQIRVMPLQSNAKAGVNATAQGIAKVVAQQVVASTPSTSSGSSTPDVDLISAVNSSLFGALDESSFTAGFSTGIGTTTASDSITPNTTGEVIISYRLMSNSNPPVFSAPWTALSLSAGAVGKLGWQKVSTTSQVNDSFNVPGTQAWCMGMLGLASNATPVFTALSFNNSNLPVTVSGLTIAAGVGLLVFVEFASNSLFSPGVSVTDSLGNAYVLVGEKAGVRAAGPQQCQISVFYCANPTGGAGASISLAGSSAGISGTAYAIYQITGLTANAATYTFQASDTSKLVEFRGAVNVTGTLPTPALAAGWQALASNNGTGTVTISSAGPSLNSGAGSFVIPPGGFCWLFSDGSNYWSTTALIPPANTSPLAHQFLTAFNSGTGAFTQAQPLFSDISGTIAPTQINALPKIPTYNSISTVSNGIPAEYATVDLSGQSAAIATTTLYSVPASGVGQYRLSWNSKVTLAATTSSVLGPLTITYTDPDNVVQTITAAAQNSAGTIETSDTGNTTTTLMVGHSMLLNCRQSTLITYAYGYTSVGATAMRYNLNIKLEAL